MAKKAKGLKAKEVGLVGAGVAALAAGAGLAYYLTTHPEVKKKAKKSIDKWMGLMHREMVSQMKKMKKMSKADYVKLVDAMAKKYVKLHKVGNAEMAKLTKEMKAHWALLEKEAVLLKKDVVKKVAKKVAKKKGKKR
jgi:hypothetical protein